ASGCCLVVVAAAAAQRSGSAPGAPSLNPLAPLGAARGAPVDLTVSGANLADPLAVWLGGPARVTLDPDGTTGKDSTKIRTRIEVPADAPIGMYRLRVATARGLSPFRAFCLDALPQLGETDSNHSPATAQAVPVPCVVVGRVDAETSDFF